MLGRLRGAALIPQNDDRPSSSNTNSLEMESSSEFYVRSNAIVSRLVAGETLVLPVRHNVGDLTSLFSFNRTGATIWNALETPRTLREICDVLDSKYDLRRERAEEDARIFVSELCSLGLAKVVVDPENTLANEERTRKILTAPE